MSESAMIKEFLVGLGFKIDKAGERKFIDSIAAATVQAVALGAAVQATASLVVAGVAKIADNLEQLYFASERTKASADNIQAFGFGVRSLGGDAAGASGSLENLARLLRNSPGGEGLLKNIGVQTRDANGELRDSVEMLGDLGKKLAEMPYYKANAFAQALGIDERTLMALRKGVGQFGKDYKDMLRAAGLDVQDAAKGSHEFMSELRLLGGAATVLVQKIASMMTGKLGVNIKHLRETFVANFGKISEVVVKVLDFVFKLADAVTILALRGASGIAWLIDKFSGLSEGSQNVLKWLGLILVAWRALSVGFLATPLGRILALGVALVALWDDYQVWKEGGKSLIDWGAWSPAIEAAIKGITFIGQAIHEALAFTGDWRPALELLLAYVAGSWLFGMLGSIAKVALGFGTIGPALTSSITGLLGNAGLVAAAGALGYGLGTIIYKKLVEGTSFGDKLGRTLVQAAAALGSKDAQESLRLQDKYDEEQRKGGVNAPVAPRRLSAAALQPATAPSPASSYGKERGLRNNNPGNIEYGPFARSQGSSAAEDAGRFAVFKDAQDGLNALAELLRNYVGRGIDSVRKIIQKYAPSGENNTEAYIASVAKRLGVDPDQKLNLRGDAGQMAGMVDAIVRVENGRNPYSKEMISKASAAPGAAPGGAQVNQTTQITIHGATDPKAVARDVSGAQNSVNEQLTRNMRGAILQ